MHMYMGQFFKQISTVKMRLYFKNKILFKNKRINSYQLEDLKVFKEEILCSFPHLRQ